MATESEQYVDMMTDCFNADFKQCEKQLDVLRNLDLFVLDNSIRESSVGALSGHTLENKWAIYNEVKKLGFNEKIVASFSNMTRVDDEFVQQLAEQGEDFSGIWSFSEITYKTKNRVPDTEQVPTGLQKLKKYGIYNCIFEVDLGDAIYDFDKFPMSELIALVKKWILWCYENLNPKARVLVSYRDPPDVFGTENTKRCFQLAEALASMPEDVRPFGIAFEEPRGSCTPEETALWSKYLRAVMDKHEWKGKLLAHVHQKFGLCDATNLKLMANGCDGVWASVCDEGAFMGAASTCVLLTNLARFGNEIITKKYNVSYLRTAAQNVTRITTKKEPFARQPVYGPRALDFVFGMKVYDFDLAGFFGTENIVRISTMSSPKMIATRLKNVFGENDQFNEEIGLKMKELMIADMTNNRKEEYMSPPGLAVLFDRAGGKLTEAMQKKITEGAKLSPHAEEMIASIKNIWDTWDVCEEGQKSGDGMLEFDSFYHAFMMPYFGCYRCEDTKKAMQSLDMDADGAVDWEEFKLYLIWAMKQYPETKTEEDLLDIAFRKGIIPAMNDEVIKNHCGEERLLIQGKSLQK